MAAMFGKYVSEGSRLSMGVRALAWKLIQGKSLNTLSPEELRFCQLVLTKVYELSLNVYLLKEAVANCGTRDNIILDRKVPEEFWKMLYDGCLEMNVPQHALLSNNGRASLWLFLNKNPQKLRGLAKYIFRRLGLHHHVHVYDQNIWDGNFIFNLGSVLACRLLMVTSFCLVYWGRQEVEFWVRKFTAKLFVLYLVLSGGIIIDFAVFNECHLNGYSGLLSTVFGDIMAFKGCENGGIQEAKWHWWLDYIFVFNNNTQLHDSH
ncbi:ORF18 [Bovine gammaherpesvirus 6]|uniref:ORF18 n=1 Tax=Bovine gammaherpesvirus 6 TaxID=1504288 RepID=A0A060CXI0_9GAMA|nr:ORF18 [Bovine gammaherpesvirus 6]AIB03173.1 ORF18 [Bovine gammaherpesvirus 6]